MATMMKKKEMSPKSKRNPDPTPMAHFFSQLRVLSNVVECESVSTRIDAENVIALTELYEEDLLKAVGDLINFAVQMDDPASSREKIRPYLDNLIERAGRFSFSVVQLHEKFGPMLKVGQQKVEEEKRRRHDA